MPAGHNIRHFTQFVCFQHSTFPFSSNLGIPLLKGIKNKFGHSVRISGIYEYITNILHEEPAALKDSVNFSLINVCSPYSQMSYGLMPPPPEATYASGSHLVLTFALSNLVKYTEKLSSKELYIEHRSVNCSVWQYKMPGHTQRVESFLTIALNSKQCGVFNIKTLTVLDLQYLYRILGVMTKAFSIRHDKIFSINNYEHFYTQPFDVYHKIYGLDFKYLVNNYGYPFWIFNKLLWEYPAFISPNMLCSTVADYYLCYILGQDSQSYIVRLLSDNGITNFITEYVADGLIQLASSIREQSKVLTQKQIIVGALLYNFVVNGRATVNNISRGTDALDIVTMLLNKPEVIGKILTPPLSVARKILSENQQYSNTLLSYLNL